MDGRLLSPKTQEEIRFLAVSRVHEGEKPELVMRVLGLSKRNIYRWLRLFKEKGEEGLLSHPPPGKPPILDESDQDWLFDTLNRKTPFDFGHDTGLWTSKLIQGAIKKGLGKKVHLSSLGRTLRKMGYSSQVPLKRALERNETAIKLWKQRIYPTLLKRVKKERAPLYFLDEMGMRSTEALAKTYGLKGQRPVVYQTGQNFGVNVISAVSLSGDLQFMVMKESFTSEVFLEFLEKMIRSIGQKFYLVVDNHSVHARAKIVQIFLENHRDKVEVILLPKYEPEMNPVEWVNSEVKRELKKRPPKDRLDLSSKMKGVLNFLSRHKEKLMKICNCSAKYGT